MKEAMNMEECEHKVIVLVNAQGRKHHESNSYETDFIVKCGNCDKVFLRTSESGKEIINLSKH